MCEVHSSKVYEACCKDCQVPVCITCIKEVHGEHAIGEIQDLYEKQKAETAEELSKMKTRLKSEIIQRIKDFKKGENEIKSAHENVREKMKKQAQDLIDHIRVILKEALQESEKDERKNREEISQHKAEAERFEQNLDRLIEKFETLTESSHPAELILFRKQNPDIFKQLKLPSKLDIVMPFFTVGQINKSQNKHQFGKFMAGKVHYVKSLDENSQHILPSLSARGSTSNKRVLGRSVKISKKKTQMKKLFHVSCRDDRSAYISGDGPGIQLIDRSGTELDNISTETEPSGLAVMQDGSLIYSDSYNKVIYKVSPNKQKTKLINAEYGPRGLCCTRSGDILVCMGFLYTARVVKYSSSGRKIQEFQTDQNGEGLFIRPSLVCENVNEDICVTDWELCKVVVLNKGGYLKFKYEGNVPSRMLKATFNPHGVATDSLGHILIADNANNAIHLISKDGDFLSYILTEDDGISQPYGISVDMSDNLCLVEQDKARVKVYQYLS
ncbi:E3 ubiquitin-protein ligase TRIM71-like [Saccostrea cucullata]|uniref:E3 ubiquitin-protein ligase TRIM71-like n=1 Tax=Saccostrea cuccullata TaxID=36930 RepID=UPI002ED2EF77